MSTYYARLSNVTPALPPLSPGYFNDLYSYDPSSLTWTPLSASPGGAPPPAPRRYHGFTSVLGKLYVHGGQNMSGNWGVALWKGDGCIHGAGYWVD
jgi:hypothetical protein